VHEQKPSRPGCWDTAHAVIYDEGIAVAAYQRNYPGKPPFEPFRQRAADGTERDFALVSAHYMSTRVLDLSTGKTVATEDHAADCEGRLKEKGKHCNCGYGFCPVGFYVPDWWDVHDGSIQPGSEYWDDKHDRWPDGTLGFVWGCYWGDDNGWKVQALDLSGVQDGVIKRDERFGYLHIDDNSSDPKTFIRVDSSDGNGPVVTFSVPRTYSIGTGKLIGDEAG
jgi:hypothetical protein